MKPSSPPPVAPGRPRWPVVAAAAVLVAAVVAAYANSFSGVFVFDDEPGILRNATLRQLWPLSGPLRPPADTTLSGRPVANLTFALNHALGGTRVWGYHAVNLLIHALAGLALFGVVRRTFARSGDGPRGAARIQGADATLVAAGAALLWLLHPVQTESVTYLVQRVESLMGLFFLLTFYGFIRARDSARPRSWRALAVAACLLGMGTKEVMAVAPVLLLLYDRTFVAGSFRRAWAERRGFHLALAATWLPLAALVASTGWNRGGTVGFDVGASAATYWLTQGAAVVHYLRLAVWPHPLVFDYATERAPGLLAALLFTAAVLALAGATGWALRRRPVAGFLGAWFFLILAPTSVVPSAVQQVVEHRMYLPLAAVAVAAAWGAHRWLGRRGAVAVFAVAAVLGGLTAQRNADYRGERALWEDTVAKCPGNDRARLNLGNVLARAGDAAAAVPHYEAALRLRPESADTHFNLGHALRQLGRGDEAIAQYREALRLDPHLAEAQVALGRVLEEAGRAAEAIPCYEAALRLAPEDAAAHTRLGLQRARDGRHAEAAVHFERAARSDPAAPEIRNNLGSAYRATGRLAEAIASYEAALRLDPRFTPARNNLARALAAAERLPEAIGQFERVVQATPEASVVRNDLGMALVMAGRPAEAVLQFQAALRLDPGRAELHLNLAVALEGAGRAAEAAEQIEAARRLGVEIER